MNESVASSECTGGRVLRVTLGTPVTLTPSFVRWDFKQILIVFLFAVITFYLTKRKSLLDNRQQKEKRKVRTMRKRNGTRLLSINHE